MDQKDHDQWIKHLKGNVMGNNWNLYHGGMIQKGFSYYNWGPNQDMSEKRDMMIIMWRFHLQLIPSAQQMFQARHWKFRWILPLAATLWWWKNEPVHSMICPVKIVWLVVWTPLKNMKVNWDDEIPNIWENKKCSKPPTSCDCPLCTLLMHVHAPLHGNWQWRVPSFSAYSPRLTSPFM